MVSLGLVSSENLQFLASSGTFRKALVPKTSIGCTLKVVTKPGLTFLATDFALKYPDLKKL